MKIHGIDDSGKVTEYSHSPVSEEKELEDYKNLQISKTNYSVKNMDSLLQMIVRENVDINELKNLMLKAHKSNENLI